jgi:surface antigen
MGRSQRASRRAACDAAARRTFASRIIGGFAAALLALGPGNPAAARGVLQCVPYARSVSGIDIHGNARTWWDQASGVYARGQQPRVGAVLAFRATGAMPYGHVAVVSRIVDERHLLLDHANWSGPGRIDRAALAEDVSDAGDWSSVRVWYAPSGGLGQRSNPTFGFIYATPPAVPGRATVQEAVVAPLTANRG